MTRSGSQRSKKLLSFNWVQLPVLRVKRERVNSGLINQGLWLLDTFEQPKNIFTTMKSMHYETETTKHHLNFVCAYFHSQFTFQIAQQPDSQHTLEAL